MKILLLNKYRKQQQNWAKFLKSWLYEGILILDKEYNYFDSTLVIGQDKGNHPIYSHSSNTMWGGTIFIDPNQAYKEAYLESELTTIARVHCANIKKANIPLRQKRIMDFVLGVAHENGHIRMGHGRLKGNYSDTKSNYRQLVELEAERETYLIASKLKYKDKTWLEIIEPEPIDVTYNFKEVLNIK
jgi:hypothetical protein